ncbi:thioesterase II family protein [Spirilliplanes yamanashiensis]|uniref:Thioesterase n=1 Tax=Spirilliplanes yamanashiensis TaxID=42233 RepID=A0A8J3Y4Z3_9ACTN|nr:alpha/beta fold hydrolase [Spirilliplanes yamanashiensis]MDP9819301.1 medium-chain acyl-[acyl-carrier-protein] hydrolase [Spirilliplanes yamanashiensis]GIJ01876.1 thioesterase [Spirilliplanes yamanashiensis]
MGGVRLFCFPFAGGGSRLYQPWRAALAEHADVRPVVLPGRETRIGERPHQRIEPLVEDLVAGLRPQLGDRYALFGHSLGALVAYEVARRLAELGEPPPQVLAVSGRRAPHLALHPPVLHTMTDADFAAAVMRLGGTPDKLLRNPRLLAHFLPVLRADYEVNETYRARRQPPLDCPVVGYAGDADPLATGTQVGAWRDTTTGPFRQRVFPGGHFFLRDAPAVLHALTADLSTGRVPVRTP